MVNSEVSGVAFSRHPLTPLSSNTVLVEAVYGLGEGLVSGELEADRYEVHVHVHVHIHVHYMLYILARTLCMTRVENSPLFLRITISIVHIHVSANLDCLLVID